MGCTTKTIFATNTSSLPIDEVAEGCPSPERVIGLHFFLPEGDLTPVVEVIRSASSSLVALKVALQVAGKLLQGGEESVRDG